MIKKVFIMAVFLTNASCSVPIHDAQFCSPVPGGYGAICDNFLTSAPTTLTEDEWLALQAKWEQAGEAVECTTSQTLGDIKESIEKLCSIASCDYSTQQKIVSGLKKIQNLGKWK